MPILILGMALPFIVVRQKTLSGWAGNRRPWIWKTALFMLASAAFGSGYRVG
ncbi:hypothetical protein [Pseudomonas sp. QD4]|uniref:hypothetical protein n=1 Tax=Pseudomonas sp. QD4 TaxID=3368618 RepID=UPI003B9ECE36